MTNLQEQADKFTSYPGQMRQVTDPDILRCNDERTGIHPWPQEKQEWIAQEGKRRIIAHIACDSDELAEEYDRLKASGTI